MAPAYPVLAMRGDADATAGSELVTALLVAAAMLASAVCAAEGLTASASAPETKAPVERSIEDLNLLGRR